MSNDLGIDRSGNGNNWTVNNITYSDQVVDSPTNNFATWNPISNTGLAALSEGNLKYNPAGTSSSTGMRGTIGVNSGKWYFETLRVAVGAGYHTGISGMSGPTRKSSTLYAGTYYYGDNNADQGLGAGSNGDIVSCAFDLDNNKIWFAKNGVWHSAASGTPNPATGAVPTDTLTSGLEEVTAWTEHSNASYAGTVTHNFGQDSSFAGSKTAQGNQDSNDIGDFYYEPPSGFLALCTSNLPEPVVPKEHFNAITYTGNGSTNAITGVGHQPAWLWIKNRASASHMWFNAKRGFNGDGDVLYVSPDVGQGENHLDDSHVRSFDSDGFTLAGTDSKTNANGNTYAAWSWKAATTFSGTTQGNGTLKAYSGVVNTDLGISIVEYIGNQYNTGHQIPHHLGSTPGLMFIRNMDTAGNCLVPGAGVNSFMADGFLQTPTNEALSSSASYFPNPAANSTVVTLGWQAGVNGNDAEHIMVCFKSVAGISKIDNYKGNGSADGTFIHTGFAPKWVLIKNTDDTDNWYIADKAREDGTGSTAGNPMTQILNTNTDGAEYTTGSNKIDFLSNGFKCRDSASGDTNISGEDYVYMAFADTPFKYSNAR
jgi:hypothetical protein